MAITAAAAVLAPIILIAALLLSLLSGTTQHNNAAVDLVFNGGVVPSSMSAEYAAQVRVMQTCLEELDSAVAEVNDQMESGSLDGNWVKAVFFSLCFWDEHLKLTPSEARDFADCFVRYEERTRTVASGTDPDTGETIYTEETYTVAVPVDQEIAFNNLDAAGYPITEDLVVNAQAVYDRIAYGAADGYTGEIQYGSSRITELDTSDFTAPTTKNAEDLVAYVTHAWESGWGYVWGTFGQTLTESLMESKIRQYPDGVGSYADVIRSKWLGGRTADCVAHQGVRLAGHGLHDDPVRHQRDAGHRRRHHVPQCRSQGAHKYDPGDAWPGRLEERTHRRVHWRRRGN